MPDEHARFGPSGAKQWINCPGWAKQTHGLPGSPESEASRKGSALHTIAETCLRAYGNPDETVADEDKEIIQPYLDHCRRLKDETGGDMVIETRVNIDTPDCWGTLDCAVIDLLTPHVHIIDLKTGAGHAVDAQDNTQLQLYACGIMTKHLGKLADWKGVKVTLHIVQPRRRDGKGAVDCWETTGDALAAFLKSIKKVLKAQRAHEGNPVAGDWCKYCPAEATCSARLCYAANVFPALAGDQADLPVPTPINPTTLDGEALHRVWGMADQIRGWLDAVDAEILRRGGIPGHTKVVMGKPGNRKWALAEEEVAVVLRKQAIDPWERKLIGIPAAEKALGGKAKAEATLAPLITRHASKPELATADDPRPGIDPAQVFPALDTSKS